MIDQIKNLIETQINPHLALHFGSCELVSVENGIATIRLFGGCSGCPSSQLTLFNGIAPIIQESFPEITDVVLE